MQLLGLLDSLKIGNLRVLTPASFSNEKSGPKRSRFMLMGIVGGIMAGLGLALVRTLASRRIIGEFEVACEGMRVLATVPKVRIPRDLVVGLLRGIPLEGSPKVLPSLRPIINSLWFQCVPTGVGGARRIVFVGVHSAAGNSVVSLCASVGLAENLSTKVSLIQFGCSGSVDGHAVKLGGGQQEVCGTSVETEIGVDGLSITVVDESASLADINAEMDKKKSENYLIIIDLPSIVLNPEYRACLWGADEVFLVMGIGRARKSDLAETVRICVQADVPIGGVILNRA